MTAIEDPCPPLAKEMKAIEEGSGGEEDNGDEIKKKKKKKRSLRQTERIIYAPQSNLGFLNYDKSSGYITIPDNHVMFTRIEEEKIDEHGNKTMVIVNGEGGEGVEMVRKLQELNKGLFVNITLVYNSKWQVLMKG